MFVITVIVLTEFDFNIHNHFFLYLRFQSCNEFTLGIDEDDIGKTILNNIINNKGTKRDQKNNKVNKSEQKES